ncbi:uncharacterized protein LOC127285264 isoform X1 [Leptopilina boulardi]|uniref:uncharacterized protein LOC127285264 isoform X1 n=2 Tax=Leptopilina boulardi TaxID=63433 RepID=UPI0021F62BD0|nr:uncharacterized protein LOC127285264 isoform X1 [Leptopilina boulardi]
MNEMKFVLDDDGTDFEDFYELIEFITHTPGVIMILKEDEEWISKISSSQVRETEVLQSSIIKDEVTITTESPTPSTSNSTLTNEEPCMTPLKWQNITPKGFNDVPYNSCSKELQLIRNVADFMIEVKTTTYSDALRMAKEIVTRFPKAFEKRTWKNGEDSIYSDGIDSLRTRIYERLKFLKTISKKRKRSESIDNAEELETRKKTKTSRYGHNQDCYGCVAFEPSLSENETDESQLSKKSILLNYKRSDEGTSEEIESLMSDTYPSQRIMINKRDVHKIVLEDILRNHWPYLTEKKYFLSHANTLLGQNIKEVWNKNIQLKIPEIIVFFRSYCGQFNKKKSFPEAVAPMKDILSEAKKANENLASNMASTLVFLPLIAKKFKEDELYILVDSFATEDKIKDKADSIRPSLIIKGNSLYDEKCECLIFIEREKVLEADTVLEGVLLLTLCFYVFGYNYPERKTSSLEFVQRMLLDINPTEGHKRWTKKSTKICRDAKTGKLIDNIVEFNSNFYTP